MTGPVRTKDPISLQSMREVPLFMPIVSLLKQNPYVTIDFW